MIFFKTGSLEKFVLAGISRNVLNLRKYSRDRQEIDCGGPLEVIKGTVVMKRAVPKELSRNRREIMHDFREIVCAWLLSHLLPQKLL